MTDMTLTLDRVVQHLRLLDRGAPDRLQGGLTQDELRDWEVKLPFQLTRELKEIYRWRNGTESRPGDLFESLYFFPGFYLLSIEEALSTYRDERFNPEWLEGWLPIFANGAGDFYIVPCQERKLDSMAVIGWIHSEPDKIVEYESLTAMIATIEECFATGAFYLNDEDMMDIDDDQQRKIAHKLNPSVAEWQN